MTFTRTTTMLIAGLLTVGLAGCNSGPEAEPGDDPTQSADADLAAIADEVGQGLAALVSSGVLVGGEVVIQEGSQVAHATAGLGSLDSEQPYPEGGHTRIASVTKAFTSAMVLQLVDEGAVDLDGTVEEYLPGILDGDGIEADQITVRHLLRMQSGLPELEPDPDNPDAAYTPRELLARIGSQPAQFPPGEEMRYTNTNYVLAGILIEELTGHDYASELNRRIAEPLGLTGTYLPETGDQTLMDPALSGYLDVEGELTDVTAQEPSGLYASGGIVSNGADLTRFFTALLAGEVVSPELLDQMRDTVPMAEVPGVEYGLGLMHLPVSCDLDAWGQAGDVPGFQAMVATGGDRAVSLQLNQSPSQDLGPAQLLGMLDTALC